MLSTFQFAARAIVLMRGLPARGHVFFHPKNKTILPGTVGQSAQPVHRLCVRAAQQRFGRAGKHHKLPFGNIEGDAFQIVFRGANDFNLVRLRIPKKNSVACAMQATEYTKCFCC